MDFPTIPDDDSDFTPNKAREIIQLYQGEIGRLRDVIDCGCNAIHDAVAVSGGDLVRIDAMQRRMRREMAP